METAKQFVKEQANKEKNVIHNKNYQILALRSNLKDSDQKAKISSSENPFAGEEAKIQAQKKTNSKLESQPELNMEDQLRSTTNSNSLFSKISDNIAISWILEKFPLVCDSIISLFSGNKTTQTSDARQNIAKLTYIGMGNGTIGNGSEEQKEQNLNNLQRDKIDNGVSNPEQVNKNKRSGAARRKRKQAKQPVIIYNVEISNKFSCLSPDVY